MTDPYKLEAEISVKDSTKAGTESAKANIGGMAGAAQKATGALGGVGGAGGLAGALGAVAKYGPAAIIGYQAVTRVLGPLATAAGNAEQAHLKVSQQLTNAGYAAKTVQPYLEAWASRTAAVTGVSKELVVELAAQGVATGKSVEQSTRMVEVASNMRGAFGSTEAAFSVLTKASEGNKAAMDTLRDTYRLTAEQGESFASALEAVGDKTSGQGAEFARTYNEEVRRMGEHFDQAKSAVGDWIKEIAGPGIAMINRLIELRQKGARIQAAEESGRPENLGDAELLVALGRAERDLESLRHNKSWNSWKMDRQELADLQIKITELEAFVSAAKTELALRDPRRNTALTLIPDEAADKAAIAEQKKQEAAAEKEARAARERAKAAAEALKAERERALVLDQLHDPDEEAYLDRVARREEYLAELAESRLAAERERLLVLQYIAEEETRSGIDIDQAAARLAQKPPLVTSVGFQTPAPGVPLQLESLEKLGDEVFLVEAAISATSNSFRSLDEIIAQHSRELSVEIDNERVTQKLREDYARNVRDMADSAASFGMAVGDAVDNILRGGTSGALAGIGQLLALGTGDNRFAAIGAAMSNQTTMYRDQAVIYGGAQGAAIGAQSGGGAYGAVIGGVLGAVGGLFLGSGRPRSRGGVARYDLELLLQDAGLDFGDSPTGKQTEWQFIHGVPFKPKSKGYDPAQALADSGLKDVYDAWAMMLAGMTENFRDSGSTLYDALDDLNLSFAETADAVAYLLTQTENMTMAEAKLETARAAVFSTTVMSIADLKATADQWANALDRIQARAEIEKKINEDLDEYRKAKKTPGEADDNAALANLEKDRAQYIALVKADLAEKEAWKQKLKQDGLTESDMLDGVDKTNALLEEIRDRLPAPQHTGYIPPAGATGERMALVHNSEYILTPQQLRTAVEHGARRSYRTEGNAIHVHFSGPVYDDRAMIRQVDRLYGRAEVHRYRRRA